MDHAEQRADREPDAELLPGLELLPRPAVHPHLATLAAFAVADKHSPAASVQVGLGERERFSDPQPRSPQHDDQRAQTHAIGARARGTHHGDDLLDGGRVGWVAPALVAGRASGVIAGQGDGLAPVAGRIKRIGCIEHLRAEGRSRGTHDGRQPRRALTLWRGAAPTPAGVAGCRAREVGAVPRACLRKPAAAEPELRSSRRLPLGALGRAHSRHGRAWTTATHEAAIPS